KGRRSTCGRRRWISSAPKSRVHPERSEGSIKAPPGVCHERRSWHIIRGALADSSLRSEFLNNLTVPNALTLLRLAIVPVFLVASFRGDFTLAFILFVSAAATDVIDGFVARRFNQRSRLGAVLDPAADKT